MITTKRQIRRDSDRFGGYYGTEDIGRPLISDYEDIGELEPIADITRNDGGSMLRTDGAPTAPAQPQMFYTTLETERQAAPAPAPAAQPLPERPVKEIKRDKEDLLPTVKTRAYATEKPVEAAAEQESEAPARREKRALDTRTKIMLCVYVVVAVILAIAVIATGVSISRASAQADAIQQQIVEKQQVIAEQQRTLVTLRDAETIRGKAAANGMVEASEPLYSVSPVETVGYPEATPRTDGFDEFCDWMSKIVN